MKRVNRLPCILAAESIHSLYPFIFLENGHLFFLLDRYGSIGRRRCGGGLRSAVRRCLKETVEFAIAKVCLFVVVVDGGGC